MKSRSILQATLFAVIFSLTACGGGSTTVQQIDTQGQQLLDLKEAYDKGVITAKEYEKTKAKILKQR